LEFLHKILLGEIYDFKQNFRLLAIMVQNLEYSENSKESDDYFYIVNDLLEQIMNSGWDMADYFRAI
jgi:hypothetical protein